MDLPCSDYRGETTAQRVAACVAAGALATCARRNFRNPDGAPSCPVDCWRWQLGQASVPGRVREILEADRLGGATLAETSPLAAVRALAPGKCLVAMVGPAGVGKTVAACWALSRARSGLYCMAADLVRPGVYRLPQRDEDEAPVPRAVRVGVLVVDQLGRESGVDWGASQLETVIVQRYEERRLTILVGNITRAALLARYGAILADRIEGSDGATILCPGKSLRGAP
jgi:hypothetical protein